MFVQIIRAAVADEAGLKNVFDEDRDRDAPGFLGVTGGITTKGELLIAARFQDAESARANSNSAEQSESWAQIEKHLAGPAEFLESTDVDAPLPGSNDAGFVQMMRATVKDRARYEELDAGFAKLIPDVRPDVIGHMNVWLPDGRVHVVDWFTSEAEARAGEKREMPADLKTGFDEWMSLLSDVEWFDINEPFFA